MVEPDTPYARRFYRSSRHPFLMCRNCRTHVVSFQQNYDFQVRRQDRELIICRDPVNVRIDDYDMGNPSFIHNQPVVNVYCNRCNRNIAKQFVVTGVPIGDPYVEEGKFAFHTRQTLLWNGAQVVYPETNEPADERRMIPAKRKLEF